MPSENTIKKQARAYAAENGVPYAMARRVVEEQHAATPALTRRVWSIQQGALPTGKLPYPFFIDEDGLVGRQDFWRGQPFRLVGFVAVGADYEIALTVQNWLTAPESAVGMEPVMEDEDGSWATFPGVIEQVRAL